MNEIIENAIIPFISSLLTGGATYFFTRRKYLAEVNSVDIQSMRDSLKFYVDIVEDNKKRIDMYQTEIQELRDKILRQEKAHEERMNESRKENLELRRQLQELTIKLIDKSVIPADSLTDTSNEQ